MIAGGPLDILESEVRELVRRRGIDPAREGNGSISGLIDEVLPRRGEQPAADRGCGCSS
jgi:hypothetical protein